MAWTENVEMATSGIDIGYGVSIGFASTSGHTFDDEWQWLEDDEFILMQFTGLKDKKGKAIYEGDDISFSMSQSQHYRGYVEWSEKGLCYLVYCYWEKHDEIPHLCDGFELNFTYRNTCVKRLDSDCFDLEIIGNVTENPELLK